MGNGISSVEKYLEEELGVEKVDYVTYQRQVGFLDLFSGVFSEFFFNKGEGLGSSLTKSNNFNFV